MRSHVVDAPPEADEAAHNIVKLASLCDYSDDDDDGEQDGEDVEESMDEEAEEIASSKLRQNSMKKRKRSEGSGKSKMFVCKICGKGFQSQKAMCGHMACHSEKRKSSNISAAHKKSSTLSSDQKFVMGSDSDAETNDHSAAGGGHWRRSKRVKNKANVASAGHKAFRKPNFSAPNDSGGFSALVVEDEHEEVAKTLMMLSRDSSQLSVNMEDYRWIYKSSGGQSQVGVRLKRRLNLDTELANEVRNQSGNDSASPEVCNDSIHNIDSAHENVKASMTLLKQEGKHHSRRNEGSVKFVDSGLETDLSPPTPDMHKGKDRMDRSCGSKQVKHYRRTDEIEQVPLQDSSSQDHFCIDLNQPALFKDGHFMPW